jgi:hypothetical protein
MANSKGSSNMKSWMCYGKHALPPKSPFPSVSPSYADFVPNPANGSKVVQKPRAGNAHHQRTSSESFLIEEQPSWLDDLLNEPETPVRRGGHRRSSSDSFAYIDVANASNLDYSSQDEYISKTLISASSWGSQDFDHHKDVQNTSFYADANLAKPKNMAWESFLKNAVTNPSSRPVRDTAVRQSSGSSCSPQETDGFPSTAREKQDQVESSPQDPKASSERRDGSHAKPSASETDTKRAKQYVANFVDLYI